MDMAAKQLDMCCSYLVHKLYVFSTQLNQLTSVEQSVQKLKEFYNDVFPELSHESATPQTYVFYIIVHMLVI